jgi:4-hydroxy-tetrahydrodipicolinate synthase
MQTKHKLKGMIPAIVTPLNEKKALDQEGYRKIVNYIMDNGCSGVMILGTAGEGTDVARNTYLETLKASVEIVNGRGAVVVGTGSSNYENIIENINAAFSAGADAVLNVPPFYHKLTQEMIYQFYSRLADDSKLPLMIYNLPDVTKNNVDLETAIKLKTHENIVGIKDSSGNLTYFQQLVCQCKSDDFEVFMGRAPLTLLAILLGASGTMTPLPNLNLELEASLYKYVEEGNLDKAKQIMMKIQEMVKLYSSFSVPISATIKGLMSRKGICKKISAGFIPTMSDAKIEMMYQQYLNIIK